MRKITIVLALICTSFGAYAQEMLTPTRSTTNDFRGRVEGAVEWGRGPGGRVKKFTRNQPDLKSDSEV